MKNLESKPRAEMLIIFVLLADVGCFKLVLRFVDEPFYRGKTVSLKAICFLVKWEIIFESFSKA